LRRRPSLPDRHETQLDGRTRQTGTILVVEDDPEVRELLEIALQDEGHRTVGVPEGIAALELVTKDPIHPDVILADYELPNGLDGVGVSAMLREKLRRPIPVVILTGDISTSTMREIAREDFVQLYKPVKLSELTRMVQRLLVESQSALPGHRPDTAQGNIDQETPVVFIVDDERHVCESMRDVFEEAGRRVETYSSSEAFLRAYRSGREACLLLDAYLPGMSGLELLRRLKDAGDPLPVIMITGKSDVSVAVQAMKAGALDFIEKPVGRGDLLAAVAHALERPQDSRKLAASHAAATNKILRLTSRERQIMDMVLAGAPNKRIAVDLGISQRTVENHRASIMKKTGSKSLAALARLALAAVSKRGDTPPVPGDPPPNLPKSKTTTK
jgi:two-component system CheB/CheR fusion protein